MKGTVTISIGDYEKLTKTHKQALKMKDDMMMTMKELQVFLSFLSTRSNLELYIEEYNKQAKSSRILLSGGRAVIEKIQMKVNIKANSIFKRVQIWNGIFNLTNKELEILSAFIKVNLTSKSKNFCTKKSKDDVAKIMSFDDPNTLNNYIKKLKDKGALKYKKGTYSLNKLLNPKETKIEINLVQKLRNKRICKMALHYLNSI